MAKKIDDTTLYLIGHLHGSMEAQALLEALFDEVFEREIENNKVKCGLYWNDKNGWEYVIWSIYLPV